MFLMGLFIGLMVGEALGFITLAFVIGGTKNDKE